MDLCGPLEVQSLGGSRYLSTYLDDISKLAVIVPLAHKSDVPAITMRVIRCLEQLSGRSLVKARSDNGTEYVNKSLADFFNRKGVVHETTARYTPEQDGAAERLNRTIMERVRAMLEDSGMHKRLWAEAAATAARIRNLSPVST